MDVRAVTTAERTEIERRTGRSCKVAIADLDAAMAAFEVALDETGARIKARTSATRRQTGSPAGWFEAYHNFGDIVDWYEARASEHQDIAVWVPNISPTSLLTPEGRAISAIRITGTGDATNRKRVYFQCAIHAREWISPAVCMYFVNHLLTQHAAGDAAVVALLGLTELIVVPVVNPDGYSYTWTDNRLWRKNRQLNSGSNCVGTDLNRNYKDRWSSGVGTSSDPCSDTFKGAAAESAPEISITTDYYRSLRPIYGAIDFHSYSQLILRPFGFTSAHSPHEREHVSLGNAMRSAIFAVNSVDFTSMKAAGIYPTSATSGDWFYGDDANACGLNSGFQPYALCIELRPMSGSNRGFQLGADEIIPSGEEMIPALLLFINTAVAEPLSYIQYDASAPDQPVCLCTPCSGLGGTNIECVDDAECCSGVCSRKGMSSKCTSFTETCVAPTTAAPTPPPATPTTPPPTAPPVSCAGRNQVCSDNADCCNSLRCRNNGKCR